MDTEARGPQTSSSRAQHCSDCLHRIMFGSGMLGDGPHGGGGGLDYGGLGGKSGSLGGQRGRLGDRGDGLDGRGSVLNGRPGDGLHDRSGRLDGGLDGRRGSPVAGWVGSETGWMGSATGAVGSVAGSVDISVAHKVNKVFTSTISIGKSPFQLSFKWRGVGGVRQRFARVDYLKIDLNPCWRVFRTLQVY